MDAGSKYRFIAFHFNLVFLSSTGCEELVLMNDRPFFYFFFLLLIPAWVLPRTSQNEPVQVQARRNISSISLQSLFSTLTFNKHASFCNALHLVVLETCIGWLLFIKIQLHLKLHTACPESIIYDLIVHETIASEEFWRWEVSELCQREFT